MNKALQVLLQHYLHLMQMQWISINTFQQKVLL